MSQGSVIMIIEIVGQADQITRQHAVCAAARAVHDDVAFDQGIDFPFVFVAGTKQVATGRKGHEV